ncbi:hypothetical protein FIBSPDRAFT_1052718 [Athelia psychrophila]|uniref:Uncharacterized protein n=1 Tax=Athelia psychrophila TaxID=1759441 RepID=A0A165WRM4_9AGAM|nr:hypothetical protein FIBSPDRAFT_1052718 [Fibularhizoctonia sp. CBS 109695]
MFSRLLNQLSSIDPSCLSTHDEIAITHTASTPIPSPSSSTHNLPTITTSAEPEPRFGADVNYPHFPPLTRSITPDPQSPNELALREGVPLSRCSTAPVPDYFDDDLVARGTGRSLQVEPAARHVATASKLTRMGFSAMAQPAAAQDAAKPSRFGIKSFFKSSK